jgi:phosphatidylglycerol:prolipoprotein diacylglycerol transferase
MTIDNFAIHLGPVSLNFFGLILIAGLVLGASLTAYLVHKREEDPAHVWDALTWALLLGIVLARLFYILNPPPSAVAQGYTARWYLMHPFNLADGPVAIWHGGLSQTGALIGGALGAWLYALRHKLDVPHWADMVMPGILLGLAIAGWANVVDQKMYGPPTDLPWGIPISMEAAVNRRVPPYDDALLYPAETRFHPTPAYLSLWALLCLGAVLFVRARPAAKQQEGNTALIGALIYAPGLFLADFLRVNVSRTVFGLTGTQILAIVVFGTALVLLLRRRWKHD